MRNLSKNKELTDVIRTFKERDKFRLKQGQKEALEFDFNNKETGKQSDKLEILLGKRSIGLRLKGDLIIG